MKHSRLGIAAVVLLATENDATPALATEPQVAFGVKDGWVEFSLTQDDKPVADAQVRVFSTDGHTFAEGETWPGGRGEFPLLPGHSFRVEIKVGDRTADPILLTPIDDHVVPTNVLLSFGLAPCCKVPSRRTFGTESRDQSQPAVVPGSLPIWVQATGGIAFTILGALILWMSRRHPTDLPAADTDGKAVSLSGRLKGRPVVLVFYKGYHCNHCVSQLFTLNKDIEKFRELGSTVLAVSADPSEQTRERFKQYGAFDFQVLSDPSNAVAARYGTYTPSAKPGEDGDLLHGTFVIDRSGRGVWVNRGDGPFTENRTLLAELSRVRVPILGAQR